MYLKLDSDEYPVQNYSDLTERIYGRVARHCINVLQTIQLLFNVAVLVIGTFFDFRISMSRGLTVPYSKRTRSFSNVQIPRECLPVFF